MQHDRCPRVSLALAVVLSAAWLAASPAAADDPTNASNTIIGSWMGVSGEGNALVVTFSADGTATSSVVTEVSLDPALPTLTPGHGVWKHRGGRNYEVTIVGLLYDVPTTGLGTYQGYIRARASIRLSKKGNRLLGTDKVEFFDPAGNLVFAVPEGSTEYRRIQHVPFD